MSTLGAAVGCSEPRASHVRVADLSPQELAGLGGHPVDGVTTQEGVRLPAPAGGALQVGEEVPMHAAPGDGSALEEPGRRSASFRPDRVTQLEGEVGYYAVFTPSIAPFKRVTALDAVGIREGTPVLHVGQSELSPVAVEGTEAPPPDGRPRDRFWGSVVLDFGEGRGVPLPSVSPESRVLELRTDPEIELSIGRDGAGNFVVMAPPLPPEQVRVTYMMDAPRSYFGTPLPDLPSDALAHELSPLPPEVVRDARRFGKELGLSRGMPMSQALRTLARHFRSFEESRQPPENTGSIYLDLARARRGVCRHRAYAFVITAQWLGIVARFVQNEAHAWVEVKLPEKGFVRLDLGGAPHGLVAHGTRERPAHHAAVEDPWPRPEEYVRAEAQALAEAARALEEGRETAAMQHGAVARTQGDTSLKPTLAAGQGAGPPPPRDSREPVRLSLTGYASEILRGRRLSLSGHAHTLQAREPVEGLRVEASLALPDADEAVLLGVTVTDETGAFEAAFAVPPDLPPRDYALVVVTPGDATHAAARAP